MKLNIGQTSQFILKGRLGDHFVAVGCGGPRRSVVMVLAE